MMPQQQSELYLGAERSWFVYLLALTDCSAFKVGFSCNPLQRIHSFSRRYFERFDLHGSSLLQLATNAEARALEAAIKTALTDFRTEPPSWVPREAGGHTEWFSAVHCEAAVEQFRAYLDSDPATRLIEAATFIRGELERLSPAFEQWAWAQVRHVCELSSFAYPDPAAAGALSSLRDWLDAYRFFELSLFSDDPAIREFVTQSARMRLS